VAAKLVVGNWKMNGSVEKNRSLVSALLQDEATAGAVVCPPCVYLSQVRDLIAGSRLRLGAQNVSRYGDGAYTGDVSAQMLAEFGCRYVIVGHSERRALFGEFDADVAQKMVVAVAAGMTPIVCVGESLLQRQQGDAVAVVLAQLQAAKELAGVEVLQASVVAYEPVWAIGTGVAATLLDVAQMHGAIKTALREWGAGDLSLLYGGSVKPEGASELMALPGVDGVLVGGASLVAAQFVAICRAAM